MELLYAHEHIINYFNAVYPTSLGLQDDIKELSKIVKFPKKTVLADIGKTHRYIYFIIEGAVRTFYRDRDDNEITSWLLFEGDLAISVYSFYNQSRSFEAMETIENCTLLCLSYDNLMRLYRKHLEFNFIGRTLTEKYYILSEEKANALRMLTAKERHDELLRNNPLIFNRVPLKYIASYLGITQSTLSRIRAQKQ
jgi:CRP-like cAMP-binding protein